MFYFAWMLEMKHTSLEVYKIARALVIESYLVTSFFPSDEKFGLVVQIRRAAMSIKLNIAEGASRKSETERKRFFEISRGSLIELDAAFESAVDLNFILLIKLEKLDKLSNSCFKMLSVMISK